MKTVVTLSNWAGRLSSITLEDDDATTEAIARAAIELIQSCMSLHAGDTITVTEED